MLSFCNHSAKENGHDLDWNFPGESQRGGWDLLKVDFDTILFLG